MRVAVLVVGALHLAAGTIMALAPRPFYDEVGTFPPFNAHYLRDLATWYVAFGALLLVAARRPAWRAPLLALAVVQYGCTSSTTSSTSAIRSRPGRDR